VFLDAVVDACVACTDGGSPGVPGLLGTAGAPTVGPPPDGPHDLGGPDGPDGGPSDAPPDDPPETSWWDSFFDSDPDVEDAAESVVQDVVTETALDVASTKMPWSAGVAGTLGTVVSGSEVLAKGVGTIAKNKGRGMGGSSKGGQKIWEALEKERSYQKPPDDE